MSDPTPAIPTGHPLSPSTRDTGIVSGADEDSITDSSQTWSRDVHQGARVESSHGKSVTAAKVAGNDKTTLVVGKWSKGPPHDGDPYQIYDSSWLPFLLIVPATILAAEELWRLHAPQKFAGMLSGDDGWKFNKARQTYVSRSGATLDPHDLKRQSLILATAAGDDMRQMSAEMAKGDMPLSVWESGMARTVNDLYVTQAAIGAGGFDMLMPEIIDGIRGIATEPPGTLFSLARLQDFAQAVDDGAPRNSTVEAIQNRAGLYSDASNSIYELARRESHIAERFLFEKNVLGPTEEHCKPGKLTDGCAELTALGWVPIGTIPSPGLRTCGMACMCGTLYK